MSAIDDIIGQLPLDTLAAQTGASPDEVHDAALAVIPALLGGMRANATDPAGAQSLLGALDQHTDSVDYEDINVADGEKAAAHIFGSNQQEVVRQLGGSADAGLIGKLMPLLVPIVLSYLAKQIGGGGSPSSAGGGVLGTILEQVLKGATEGTQTTSRTRSMPGTDSILGDLLGGLLGGGRR